MAKNTSGAEQPSTVHSGQSVYTGSTLTFYDFLVLGMFCRFAWRCPRTELMRRYQAALGARHLEIGVGTAYFPAKATFPVPRPELTLVDLDANTLTYGARRLAHLNPVTIQADALRPLADAGVPARSFDSVAVNLVLHCVPGDLLAKRGVLANAAAAAKPGGTVVGSTVLAHGVPIGAVGRRLMPRLNAAGVFNNSHDSLDDLRAVLAETFPAYTLDVRGCVGLFTATAA